MEAHRDLVIDWPKKSDNTVSKLQRKSSIAGAEHTVMTPRSKAVSLDRDNTSVQ